MIRLFNNHLQTTEVSRNKRKLEKELRQDNSQRAKRAALTLADGLHENFRKRDKLLDGFQTGGHGYMYTFKYFKHLLRIDYILHSPELKGLDYFSPDWEYSDHNPVVMRMKL